ncbi:MAG: ABC transporter ATP-binding protein [Clostridia bacterium]|nr:ABC transporter ATP-binding protein [Clostridia bacterium]
MFNRRKILQYSMKYVLENKTAPFWFILYTLLSITIPLMAIYYPKIILDFIEKENQWAAMMSVVCFISLEAVLYIANSLIQTKIQDIQTIVNAQINEDIADVNISVPYMISESSEFIENKNKAIAGLNIQSGTIGIYLTLCNIVAAIIRVILSSVALSMLNPWFSIVILITVLINAFVYSYINKLEEKFWNSLICFNRMFSYIFMKLSCGFRFAKENRLYAMSDIIDEKNNEYIQYTKNKFQQKYKEALPYKILHQAIGQSQMLLIYGCLLYSAYVKGISVADFTVMLSIALSLKGWLNTIIYGVVDINISCDYLQYFYNLSKYKVNNSSKSSENKLDPDSRNIIEFKNVCFRYENAESYALSDVSVKISSNENLAIIGTNGSGKTTFIKLLLGFYRPTSGTITVNGKDISEYEAEEYLKLFSAVFQDYSIYPMSIKDNIVFGEPFDEDKVNRILTELALMPSINNMPDGIESVLNDNSQPNVLKLSGGQEQKLAIARALYKKAPIVIMDEPTASLDSLSEYKIYQNAFQIAKERHMIFTSHRVSCCKNADRVLVFDNGFLVQDGVHRDLIEIPGVYRQLYSTQEHYYT